MNIDFFKDYDLVKVALSERKDGNMRLSAGKSNLESYSNRKRFFKKSGLNPDFFASTLLIHGNRVKQVNEEDRGVVFKGLDGMITNQQEVFLSLTIADCLAIFFFDPENMAVGLAHAGWKGLRKDIIGSMVEKMQDAYNSKAENLLVYISPSLSTCHYEVGEELLEKFPLYKGAFTRKHQRLYLNIKKIAKIKLRETGIKNKNISISEECTFCEKEKYFSYRRDHYGNISNIESMVAVIGMAKEKENML